MAKIKVDIEELHESSLDNSADGEYMNTTEDSGSYDNNEKSHYVPIVQHFMDSGNATSYEEIPSSVTYKFLPAKSEVSEVKIETSPAHDTTYYVISNTAEVYDTQTVTSKKPLNSVKVDPLQIKAVAVKKRVDKRRVTHNEVERRRRDKINSWIMQLATLIPNSGLPDSTSKGGILAKACDHITDLTEKQKRLEKLEVENEKLVLEVLRLNQELADLRKENSSMRNQLADNCIVYNNQRQKGQKS